MTPEAAFTGSAIEAALVGVEREVADFFGSLADAEFVCRVADAWTPAEHLQHLNTSVSAVARGFAVAPLLLRLRFGRARAPSRSYDALVAAYRQLLERGLQAPERFAPVRSDPAPETIPEYRAAILERWQRVNARLHVGVERFDDAKLDRLRLPHPALGRLTLREMLFFTMYHNRHHIAAAKKRLPRFGMPAGH
jgi:hypothetical protein